MVEMDSLSFWMLLVSSLVVVMELVALELEATEAHVCLAGTSGFRPFDVSENESTDLIAYCSNGSSETLTYQVQRKSFRIFVCEGDIRDQG